MRAITPSEANEFVGQKHDKITVIRIDGKKGRECLLRVRCECGREKKVTLAKWRRKELHPCQGCGPKKKIAAHRMDGTFWAHVAVGSDSACWEWGGHRQRKGYGTAGLLGLAHRVAWQVSCGAIPDGLCVLHHCDNPPCCNPAHLFLGTVQDNNADRDKKGRCRAGAKRGEENPMSKLTEAGVRCIRELAKQGKTANEIARRMKMSRQQINRIIRRERWAWLN